MTVLLVLLTLVVFLTADYFIERRRRARAFEVPLPTGAFALNLPAGIQLAPNHMWLRRDEQGLVTLGIDGLLSQILGTMDNVLLPVRGLQVSESSVPIAFTHGGKSIRLKLPLMGKVADVNPDVLNDAGVVARDPYGKGWLLKLETRKAPANVPQAVVPNPGKWLKEQTAALRDFFGSIGQAPAPALLQDGGLPASGLLQLYEADVWREFNQRFAALDEDVHPEN